MARKAKSSKKAKKKTKAKKAAVQAKVWTNEEILADWVDALTSSSGLGGKDLDDMITTNLTGPLLAKIQERLDEPDRKKRRDYNDDRQNTRAVARFIGKTCKELTEGASVSLAVFEGVFRLAKLHPKCPGAGGSGAWCDIPV